MAKAVLCPVCGGSGKFLLLLVPGSTSSVRQEVECHGCNGKGWVEVSDYHYPPCITYTRDYFTGID